MTGAIAPKAADMRDVYFHTTDMTSAALTNWQRVWFSMAEDPFSGVLSIPMRPFSVLIVDDARSERLLLRQAILEARRNLRLVEAADAVAARDAFGRHPLDLVFLDIELAGASGLDLLAWLRQADPALPGVMVTHHSTQDVVVKALRQGAFGFIVKPYSLSRLKEIFAKLDRRSTSAGTLQATPD